MNTYQSTTEQTEQNEQFEHSVQNAGDTIEKVKKIKGSKKNKKSELTDSNDESKQDNSKEESKQDNSKDESKQDNSNDESKQDNSKDEFEQKKSITLTVNKVNVNEIDSEDNSKYIEEEYAEGIEIEDEENIEKTHSKEELLIKFDVLLETLGFFIDELKNLPDYDLTKDFIKSLNDKSKKFNKSNGLVMHLMLDFSMKKTLKATHNKKNKKPSNKETHAIHTKNPTYPEVLTFMNLEEDTQISRAMIIQYINDFVKKERADKNPEIFVEGNNRFFRICGKLQILFSFIHTQMELRGCLEEIPETLQYIQIMKYVKYCFEPK